MKAGVDYGFDRKVDGLSLGLADAAIELQRVTDSHGALSIVGSLVVEHECGSRGVVAEVQCLGGELDAIG